MRKAVFAVDLRRVQSTLSHDDPLWTLLVATILPYVWFSISNPLRKTAYAPAVLVAHLVAPGSTLAPKLATAWVLLRVGHGAFYLANNAPLRTVCFALASFCSVAFYLIAAQVF